MSYKTVFKANCSKCNKILENVKHALKLLVKLPPFELLSKLIFFFQFDEHPLRRGP
jgi:hypothetical protein